MMMKERDLKSNIIWYLQDVSRLYKAEETMVQVSLIEGQKILAGFTERLQKYAEKKIQSREQMQLLKANVTGTNVISVKLHGDYCNGPSDRKVTSIRPIHPNNYHEAYSC